MPNVAIRSGSTAVTAVVLLLTTLIFFIHPTHANEIQSSLRGQILDTLTEQSSDEVACATSGSCFFVNNCCRPTHVCKQLSCQRVCNMAGADCRSMPCCPPFVCDSTRNMCIFPPTASPTIPPPTAAPTPRNCSVLPQTDLIRQNLVALQANSTTCGDYVDTIDDMVDPIADATTKVKTVFSITVKTVNTIVDIIADIIKEATTSPFKGILNIIPFPYRTIVQLVLKAIQLALKTASSVLDKLERFVSAIDKLGKGLKAVGLGLKGSVASFKSQAAIAQSFNSFEGTAINCVLSTTETCADNDALENTNKDFSKTVNSALDTSRNCVRTFDTMKKALEKIRDAIVDPIVETINVIVDAVLSAVQKFIDEISALFKKIKEKLSEAYCCGTPYPLQVSGNAIGLTIDLLTCPAQGTFDTVESLIAAEVDKLIAKMQSVLNNFIQPMKDSVSAFNLPTLEASAGSIDRCVLRLPGFSVQYANPFQEFLDWTFDPMATRYTPSLWGAIKKACNDAYNAFDDTLAEDCCKPYKPLSDGSFCDPSGIIAYSHCSQCTSNTNNYWPSKVYVACGKQSPCWGDGVLCARGTTCDACCNSPTYWYSKVMDACGPEPKWGDGTACALGSSCNACRNAATHWWGKAFTACGSEPKWGDGTVCAQGTTCKACNNAATFWYSKGITACGREPCWGDGTVCAAGTTCNACCRSYTYWNSKVFTACGSEPCWGDGAICALGTSCKNCCRSAGYWYAKVATCCGSEPCWGRGTLCLGGTTCNRCCAGDATYNWLKVAHYCD